MHKRPSLISFYTFRPFQETLYNLHHREIFPVNEVSKKDLTKTELLKKVLHYIDHNYKQKLTVMDLASQIQMSEGHFSRFFKSLVLMTPMQYINTTRNNKACTLLQKSDRKMLDIAMDVGFQNQSYFIRLFKKQKGCTPREYRLRYG